MTRIGFGFDAHRFGGDGPVILCGIAVDVSRGLEGTSDADVGLHALADALLGAAALGDLGLYFPSNASESHGADSSELLSEVVRRVTGAGFEIGAVDVTVVAETVRVGPYREAMRDRVASLLGIDRARVSIKATTTDGMGFLGRDEGIAAMAVATIEDQE